MEILITVAIGVVLVGVAFAHDRLNKANNDVLKFKEQTAKALNRLYGDNRFQIGGWGELIDNNEKEYL